MSSPESIKPAATDKQVWGLWSTAGLGCAVGIVFNLVQLLIAVVFVVLQFVPAPKTITQQYLKDLSTNGLLIALTTFAATIICVGLIIIFVKLRKGATIREYLGLRPINSKTILASIAIAAGLMILSDGLSTILGRSVVTEFQINIYKTSVWPILLWIALVLFAPVFEETLFRGFLFEGFRQSRIGIVGTIILTSFLWTILHIQYGIYELVMIFIWGIIFGMMRFKTKSLWSPLLMHALLNLGATIETVLYINGVIS